MCNPREVNSVVPCKRASGIHACRRIPGAARACARGEGQGGCPGAEAAEAREHRTLRLTPYYHDTRKRNWKEPCRAPRCSASTETCWNLWTFQKELIRGHGMGGSSTTIIGLVRVALALPILALRTITVLSRSRAHLVLENMALCQHLQALARAGHRNRLYARDRTSWVARRQT